MENINISVLFKYLEEHYRNYLYSPSQFEDYKDMFSWFNFKITEQSSDKCNDFEYSGIITYLVVSERDEQTIEICTIKEEWCDGDLEDSKILEIYHEGDVREIHRQYLEFVFEKLKALPYE